MDLKKDWISIVMWIFIVLVLIVLISTFLKP